ncbi:MAG: iron export ABC transporter permease subunit FetB [Salinivirgaceae bacterium]|nr:MAG: iron export ABC transporter permease subunit FetB [Salinivirgaceae bacterium]
MSEAAANIGVWAMVFAFLLVVPPMVISFWLKLGIVKRTLISTARMGVQLAFVGFYLHYIFDLNNSWINVGYLLLMTVIASFSAIKSCDLKWQIFFFRFFVSSLLPLIVLVFYFDWLIIDLNNLFDARYLIPIGGMLLGNTLKANVIGVDRFFSSLKSQRESYESLLAFGASRAQALRPFYREALRASVNPMLATMATVGLVSLPGMMTGQILGGSLPVTAIKYQIAIMTAIFSNNILSVLLTLWLASPIAFNKFAMLKKEIFRG